MVDAGAKSLAVPFGLSPDTLKKGAGMVNSRKIHKRRMYYTGSRRTLNTVSTQNVSTPQGVENGFHGRVNTGQSIHRRDAGGAEIKNKLRYRSQAYQFKKPGLMPDI